MNSLIVRLVSLCAIVAVLASAICAFVGVRSVLQVVDSTNFASGITACSEVEHEIDEVLDSLSFEVSDYAQWDELYNQSPRPEAAWAKINLIPGSNHGRICQEMLLLSDNQVTGRFDYHGPRGNEPTAWDPVPGDRVLAVCTTALRGLAWFDGRPALWASRPVVHSDGSGAPHGTLVGLAYITDSMAARLTPFEWRFRLLPPGTAVKPSDGETIRSSRTYAASDARPVIEVERDRMEDLTLRATLVHNVTVAGLVVPLIAIIAGVLLGWNWLRPLRQLSAACRRRANDPEVPIPDGGDLDDTRILAQALRELAAAERSARQRLAADLAGAEASNAMRRRAVARLAADAAEPLSTIQELSTVLCQSGGLLTPENVNQLSRAADALAEHMHQASGLAGDHPTEGDRIGPADLATYAAGVVGLLQPELQRRYVRLACAVSGQAGIDASLLTPILVNLLSNAIRACPEAGRIELRGGSDAGRMWWEIEDFGSGIAPDLAQRLVSACERGEVLPGDPGVGLGLALAITNAGRAGGRLHLVRSAPGNTLFRLELPLPAPTPPGDGISGRTSGSNP